MIHEDASPTIGTYDIRDTSFDLLVALVAAWLILAAPLVNNPTTSAHHAVPAREMLKGKAISVPVIAPPAPVKEVRVAVEPVRAAKPIAVMPPAPVVKRVASPAPTVKPLPVSPVLAAPKPAPSVMPTTSPLVVESLPAAPSKDSNNPFVKARQTISRDLKAFTKWISVQQQYEEQKQSLTASCTTEECDNVKWEKLLSRLQGQPVATQMREVNAFFNAMPYINDAANWGTNDRWNTPYELMERGGDCEDYAIAKYLSLKRLGISASNMRIMIVQDQKLGGVIHAVLEVTINNTRYLLDNQAKHIVAENSVYHYQPIYALNTHSWWAYQ